MIELTEAILPAGTDETDKPFDLQRDFPLHYLAKIGNPETIQNYFEINRHDACKQLQRFDFLGRSVLHYAASTVNLSEEEKCVTMIIKYFNDFEKTKEIDEECKFENTVGVHKYNHHHYQRHQNNFLPQLKRFGNHPHQHFNNSNTNHRIWHGSRNFNTTIKFINKKDINEESPVHIAARNENAGIVSTLLINGADVFSVSQNGENTLELIYSKTPGAVLHLLNKSISFDCATDMDNFTKTERSYIIDFTAIIGEQYGASAQNTSKDESFGSIGSKLKSIIVPSKETQCLHIVSKLYPAKRKDILSHPLVQLFVEKKAKMFKWVIWTSLFFHLTWIGIYMWHAWETYYKCCELDHLWNNSTKGQEERVYCSKYPFDTLTDSWTKDHHSRAFDAVVNCFSDSGGNHFRTALISFLSAIVFFSIILQISFLWKDYIRPSNLFIWIFFIFLMATLKPTVDSFKWQFQLTSFTILIGAFLILEEVNKHVYWTIYIRVLMKVIKRFIAILPLFLFLMLAFATSLRMLFPDLNPPVSDFLNAMMDVFGTVANGKVEWRDGRKYKDSIANGFEASGVVMFIAFYVTMILLLFRILIGFVVSDTKKIQEQEELNEIKQDLETLFLFESFLCSRGYSFLCSVKCLNFLRKIRVGFMLCQNQIFQVSFSESDIPHHLRKSLRLLASKNPIKSSKELTL